MSYRVDITESARELLSNVPKSIQIALADQITLLARNLRPVGARRIRGQEDCYRIRKGDYRIVYAVFDVQPYYRTCRSPQGCLRAHGDCGTTD